MSTMSYGTLYGTTFAGGAHAAGTVFKITKKGVAKVLHSFRSVPDGAEPLAGLIDVGGTLYGTTSAGGVTTSGTGGTVFKITTAGVDTVLHSFKGGSHGALPGAGLIDVAGPLYGTTANGGTGSCSGGCGTVFKITKAGVATVLYSFKGGSDGIDPGAGLINVAGTLYGTTIEGGANHAGTVFKITTEGVETVLYSFQGGSDGAFPEAGLIEVGGVLYGTTSGGGSGCLGIGCGTVFKLTTAGVETVLYSFKGGSDGADPFAGLIEVGGTVSLRHRSSVTTPI